MAYECKFCAKVFVREGSFMKHRCKEMERADDIKTPTGLAAYEMYSLWMRHSNRKVPPIETFSTSRYFGTFYKFIEHSKKLKLPNKEQFVKLMISKDIPPTLWNRDECYSFYLEWLDRTSDPLDQAAQTIDTLYKIAELVEVPVNEVFTMMHYREVMQLIRQRQISPWLLLCSKEFKAFLLSLEASEKEEILNLIGYAYWAEKFEANPNVVEQMKLIASEMGI